MYAINKFLKRFFDVFMSAFALLALSPMFLIIAIAIRADSSGPVFFKQERRGKDGCVYKMYKFRSMVVNAEKMGTGLFNYTGDPRVTRVGRWLRDSSIDELPQIWNVLKGDMTIVGPRPAVTYELGDFETLNRRYKKRFSVRPGITGYAQVMGRNEITWDQKVNYDNEYIELFKKQGIVLDIVILIKTTANVFKSRDIYEEKIDEALDDKKSAIAAEQAIIAKAHEIENGDEEVVIKK